ncbi:MAG: hypothetical protein JJU29_18645 [Verrucomicrobia bacterium]|nr:hypothetical protein [Verrucomicrobiota bacterium]MCH8514623.1 hypothetical protein [Kiritimatiellia bacterium]
MSIFKPLTLIPLMLTSLMMPSHGQIPEQLEGPIEIRKVNGGRLAWRFLGDRGDGAQNLGLWIAEETETVRGVVFSLHNGTEAYLEDLHAFCRQENFALYAALIRWADFELVLPDQLAKLSGALGHPEIPNVPWAVIGGSRNVGALLNFTRLDAHRDQRILCMLFNGGPGPGLNLGDTPVRGQTLPDAEIFAGIPMLTVNGAKDPYTDHMKWQTDVYPRIRARNFSAAVAADWNAGHARQRADVLYFPFILEAYNHRVPKDHDFRDGPVTLKPFRFEDGWMTEPIDWDNPATGEMKPAADGPDTVWLPSREFGELWNRFHLQGQSEEEIIAMWYSDGIPFWREAKRPADVAGYPENIVGLPPAARATLEKLGSTPPPTEAELRELRDQLRQAVESPFKDRRDAAKTLLERHTDSLSVVSH